MDFKNYNYNFKFQEVWWFILTNCLVMGAQWYLTFDPTTVTDWRAWAFSIGISGSRVAVAAFLAKAVPMMLDAVGVEEDKPAAAPAKKRTTRKKKTSD